MLSQEFLTIVYLIAGILFILSLGGLSNQETARRGNMLGAIGMGIAILATALGGHVSNIAILLGALVIGGGVGTVLAKRVAMTAMPELVAILHSFVGLAAVLVGIGTFLEPGKSSGDVANAIQLGIGNLLEPGKASGGAAYTIHLIEVYLGVFIGGITFVGSVMAWGKLRGSIGSKPLTLPGRHWGNLILIIVTVILGVIFVRDPANGMTPLLVMTGISFILGWHVVMAIGGADMPVVVSMLNSYSGWAAAAAGFMLSNDLLIVTGALVGSSGAILSYIMCRAMNRSFVSVILGGFGGDEGAKPAKKLTLGDEPVGSVTSLEAFEVGQLLEEAQNIMIVPGYGMAVAQAQHIVRELTTWLRERNKVVRFAIHPVAGRLPGHMNVLLAEANIPYDIVFEMEDVEHDMEKVDVALVVGANDIVNPAALEDAESPIFGMPVVEVWRAGIAVVMKRSMAAGYAGIDNPLYYKENTRMLFGDAKASIDGIVTHLKGKAAA